MTTTPRALARARALSVGTVLAATVVTGGVVVHLADAQNGTATAAGTTTDSSTSGTSSSTTSSNSSSSSSSNGFAASGTVSSGTGPVQSSTNGS